MVANFLRRIKYSALFLHIATHKDFLDECSGIRDCDFWVQRLNYIFGMSRDANGSTLLTA